MSDTPQRRSVAILGSTGSIGCSALEVVRQFPERFEVAVLAAGANTELLARQIEEFRPRHVVVADEGAAKQFSSPLYGADFDAGPEALEAAAAIPVGMVLCALVGAVGLRPLLSAIDAGNNVAVVNKAPFVMAGKLIIERARAKGVTVVPVDSEHSAIFQCLHGNDAHDVAYIHLTASGGPFYGRDRASLANIRPEEAVKHPTWDMGEKISVDSATLMNKGLEIIEAMWLFDLPPEAIDVLIHPQSIVHSLVEFKDGNILAHLGVTDMKFPILYALGYPVRAERAMARLDLKELGELTFAAPDFNDFPCLAHARDAAKAGGTAPAILNAANEAAVTAFCAGKIPFLGISDVVGRVREACAPEEAYGLESVLAADTHARAVANEVMQTMGIT